MAQHASFGLTLPQRAILFDILTPKDLLELAVTADSVPAFDSVWVGDSLTAKPRPESVTLLGALAGATRRIRLGVGCLASFPVRDPITFAYQWATLDVLSAGRTQLAVCNGLVAAEKASAREGSHWGVTDKQRAARMEENIEICRLLWTGAEVSFDGKFTSFDKLSLLPKPIQDPCPIWIAANPAPGPFYERALRRVANLADGWMCVEIFPNMMATAWTQLKVYLTEAGKDPATFPTFAYHNFNHNPDRDAALAETQRFLDKYYGPVFTPAMTEVWTAAGPIDRCVADLRKLIEGGVKQISLRLTSWDQRGQLKCLIDDVLPRLTDIEVGQ